MEGKMSKEELLKYLIAEIDLIMHDKDYRFENANGTWYSRESCRDLTNEEVFEELRTELRQFADLEAKLAEKERQLKLAEELLIKQEKEYDEQLEKQTKIYYKHLKEKDQDKISFAIEQLEKVKENIHYLLSFDYNLLSKVNEQFDNQIKQLKEMK